MRTNSQSWFLGTSQNFNGNQLYLGDETFNITRLTIQPNGGPIYLQGQMTQDHGSYGLPKALVYLNANGTINRCYNGLNGATTSGCGLSVVRIGAGHYQVTFPFDISSRFFAVTAQQGCCPGLISVSYNVFGTTVMDIGVLYKDALIDDYRAYATDRPVMIVVY